MAEHVNYEKLLHDRAAITIKAHGIVSLVFGILGVALGVLIALGTILFGGIASNTTADLAAAAIYAFCWLVFVVIPHIYLIIAGVHLMKLPSPRLAKALIITNLVVGVFYNLVILVLAIINLTQLHEYKPHLHKNPK